MSGPILFVSHFKIKEGKLEGFRRRSSQTTELIRSTRPRTAAFVAYLGEDRRELSIVHFFPDADAMDEHVEGAAERAREAFEYIEQESVEIYGRPSEHVLEMFEEASESGVELTIMPEQVAGFFRLNSG
jgi:hypothetical protein